MYDASIDDSGKLKVGDIESDIVADAFSALSLYDKCALSLGMKGVRNVNPSDLNTKACKSSIKLNIMK